MGINKKQIKEFISNPSILSKDDSKKLASLVNDYPYFQTARLLYTKSLQNEDAKKFDEALKMTATYAVDRKKLFEFFIPTSTESEVDLDFLLNVVEEPVAEAKPESQPEVAEEPKQETPMQEESVPEVAEAVSEEPVVEAKPESQPEVAEEPKQETPMQEELVSEVADAVSEEPVVEAKPESQQEVVAEPEQEIPAQEEIVSEVVESVPKEPVVEVKTESQPVVAEEPKQETPMQEETVPEVVETVPEEPVAEAKPENQQEFVEELKEDAPKQNARDFSSLKEEITVICETAQAKSEAAKQIQGEVKEQKNAPEKLDLFKNVAPVLKSVDEKSSTESLADRILRECREMKAAKQKNATEKVEEAKTPKVEENIEAGTEQNSGLLDFSLFSDVPSQAPSTEPAKVSSTDDEVIDFVELEETINNDWFERQGKPKSNASQMDLINKFIQEDPKMPDISQLAEKSEISTEDLSKSSSEEHEFLTESMAKIYLNQKLFSKALEIYEKLSLKNPEKSVYFANRILEIKELLKK